MGQWILKTKLPRKLKLEMKISLCERYQCRILIFLGNIYLEFYVKAEKKKKEKKKKEVKSKIFI